MQTFFQWLRKTQCNILFSKTLISARLFVIYPLKHHRAQKKVNIMTPLSAWVRNVLISRTGSDLDNINLTPQFSDISFALTAKEIFWNHRQSNEILYFCNEVGRSVQEKWIIGNNEKKNWRFYNGRIIRLISYLSNLQPTIKRRHKRKSV